MIPISFQPLLAIVPHCGHEERWIGRKDFSLNSRQRISQICVRNKAADRGSRNLPTPGVNVHAANVCNTLSCTRLGKTEKTWPSVACIANTKTEHSLTLGGKGVREAHMIGTTAVSALGTCVASGYTDNAQKWMLRQRGVGWRLCTATWHWYKLNGVMSAQPNFNVRGVVPGDGQTVDSMTIARDRFCSQNYIYSACWELCRCRQRTPYEEGSGVYQPFFSLITILNRGRAYALLSTSSPLMKPDPEKKEGDERDDLLNGLALLPYHERLTRFIRGSTRHRFAGWVTVINFRPPAPIGQGDPEESGGGCHGRAVGKYQRNSAWIQYGRLSLGLSKNHAQLWPILTLDIADALRDFEFIHNNRWNTYFVKDITAPRLDDVRGSRLHRCGADADLGCRQCGAQDVDHHLDIDFSLRRWCWHLL